MRLVNKFRKERTNFLSWECCDAVWGETLIICNAKSQEMETCLLVIFVILQSELQYELKPRSESKLHRVSSRPAPNSWALLPYFPPCKCIKQKLHFSVSVHLAFWRFLSVYFLWQAELKVVSTQESSSGKFSPAALHQDPPHTNTFHRFGTEKQNHLKGADGFRFTYFTGSQIYSLTVTFSTQTY